MYAHKTKTESLQKMLYASIKQNWRNHATSTVLGRRWIHNIWKNFSSCAQEDSKNAITFSLPSITGPIVVLGQVLLSPQHFLLA